MGLYDRILLEDGVELPEFPDDKNPRRLEWQSKDIGNPSGHTFKITNDGRLMRKDNNKDSYVFYNSLHGSFEFHASGRGVDGFDDFYWSYEARFTEGELDEIVFLGERSL